MHFPMRFLRSDSQRAEWAAVTGRSGGAAEVDEGWDRGNVGWRKGVARGSKQSGCIRGRGIAWTIIDCLRARDISRMMNIRSLTPLFGPVSMLMLLVLQLLHYQDPTRKAEHLAIKHTIQTQRSSHPLLLSLALPVLALPFFSVGYSRSPRWLRWCCHRKLLGYLC